MRFAAAFTPHPIRECHQRFQSRRRVAVVVVLIEEFGPHRCGMPYLEDRLAQFAMALRHRQLFCRYEPHLAAAMFCVTSGLLLASVALVVLNPLFAHPLFPASAFLVDFSAYQNARPLRSPRGFKAKNDSLRELRRL